MDTEQGGGVELEQPGEVSAEASPSGEKAEEVSESSGAAEAGTGAVSVSEGAKTRDLIGYLQPCIICQVVGGTMRRFETKAVAIPLYCHDEKSNHEANRLCLNFRSMIASGVATSSNGT